MYDTADVGVATLPGSLEQEDRFVEYYMPDSFQMANCNNCGVVPVKGHPERVHEVLCSLSLRIWVFRVPGKRVYVDISNYMHHCLISHTLDRIWRRPSMSVCFVHLFVRPQIAVSHMQDEIAVMARCNVTVRGCV
jgi:hypothetical protein